jgi:methylated-DNA-[protein]-cysteine S-methyltransferase
MTSATAQVDERLLARFRDRAEAEGLVDVAFTTMDSPVGTLLLAATKRGLVEIAYTHAGGVEDALRGLAAKLSPRLLEAPRRLDPVRRQLDSYFTGRLDHFDVPLDWSLAGQFTRRVLRQTSRIPYGGVSTYGEIAKEIGSPRASRAVGNALGANPIPVIVPCHRVLRAGGLIGGYGGGVNRKEFLLKLEGALSQ